MFALENSPKKLSHLSVNEFQGRMLRILCLPPTCRKHLGLYNADICGKGQFNWNCLQACGVHGFSIASNFKQC